MYKVYACHEAFLREYLSKINSATNEQLLLAAKYEPNPRQSVATSKGIANINITGILLDEIPPIAKFFGFKGTTYQEIIDAVSDAKASDAERVTLSVNSPGGIVSSGLEKAWDAIADLAKSKEVIALNSDMMASAAYWVASAANEIYSTSGLSTQGSIGVYAEYTDWTDADKKAGIKEVRIVSDNAPLKNLPTDDARLTDQIRERLNDIEAVFLEAISKGRGIPVDKVAKTFGKGGMLNNADAEKVGMIDGIRSESKVFSTGDSASAANEPITNGGDMPTLKEFLAANPGATYELDAIRQEACAQAVTNERAAMAVRMKSVLPFATNTIYSERVRSMAIDIIANGKPEDALTTAVIYEDQQIEAKKQADKVAQAAALEETPAIQPTLLNQSTYLTNGKITTLEDLELARKARA
jgi:ClpP class serine protease